MQQNVRWLWLVLGAFYVLGCMPPLVIEQPKPSDPYAILAFTASMRLLALNDQPVDAPTHLGRLRVRPGQHILRFAHVNAGVDGSADHAGQLAAPFTLQVHAGVTYHFESKT